MCIRLCMHSCYLCNGCQHHTLSYYNNIGMLYFQLANLDPAFRSKLESISLVAIFHCNLLEHYSIDAILKPFIQDLKNLETYDCINVCASNLVICMHNHAHRV